MSQRQGHCSLGSRARCHRAPSPGCWQQGKCAAGSCPCKCTAVSIWFPGEMCPAHPSRCHGEGAKQTAGRVGSSAACRAGYHGANKERGYLQPAGDGHPRPGTTSAHCIAVRPATVRHMGSYRGGGWRQLCSRSRSSRGICSFQQEWQQTTQRVLAFAGAQSCTSASALLRADLCTSIYIDLRTG